MGFLPVCSLTGVEGGDAGGGVSFFLHHSVALNLGTSLYSNLWQCAALGDAATCSERSLPESLLPGVHTPTFLFESML